MSNVKSAEGPLVPTIPREVAEAIEFLRKEPDALDNAKIIEVATPSMSRICIGRTVLAVRSIPFDTLLAALVNGYTVEKTPEEAAEEARQATYDSIHEEYDYYFGLRDNYDVGFRKGIRFTLNALGVKIPGVSVSSSEVSI